MIYNIEEKCLYFLLIALCIIFVNGRLIQSESIVNEPLTIDVISTNNVPILPQFSTINRANISPVTANKTNTSVCYPVVGCFDNNEPYNNAGLEVPQSPEHISTQFLLFTQEAPSTPEFLVYDSNDQSIIESNLNSSRWLRIIVHGFTNNRNSIWIKPLQDELLKLKDNELSDVLVVDWGHGAKFPLYTNAASNTRLVGKQIGLLLQKLHNMKGFSYDKIHCIGHSLGAHTCSLASNIIDNQMARISGLDPAGPLFEGKDVLVRLDKNDAKFVDVIHTNTDIAFGVGLGSSQSSGHVDFYANGGQHQPGCPSVLSLLGNVIHGHSEAIYEQTSCSHGRSHGYFTESINSECRYNAFPCQDYNSFVNGQCLACSTSGCAQMGFYSVYSLGRGNMYLSTKNTSPFCGNHYLIELVLNRDMIATSGEIYVSIHSNYEILTNVSMTMKSKADIKPGDIFRHVFSYKTDLGKVDYAIVHFNKAKNFFGWGAEKGNEIVISRLRLKSLEDSVIYSGLCETHTKIEAHAFETVLLNRSDCLDPKENFSSSNKSIILSSNNENLSLPKIAAATTHIIDRHLARIVAGNAENLRAHLDSMYKLLRPDDRLTLMVQLESGFPNRFRYLVIVTCVGRQETEESAILGFDVGTNEITIGMTLPIWADLDISLDGDGGFKLTSYDRCHIFKPVSVQALWTAYQSLHKASNQARLYNYIANNGITHSWIEYYRNPDIRSNQIYVNEWNQMDDILSHRSDSPHLYQPLSSDEETLRARIHVKLKEIMLQVDLDEVTSKFLREQLENAFQMSLSPYKQYIDDVMLQILAQMDKPTMILPYLYLGSEWNASNFEELKANNIGYVLNVSREIDNFFPGHFKYLNVRVHDQDDADLLKEWEKTFRFINEAKANNQCCLVHCKMGISRSASTVLAYLMKENNHSFADALEHVKKRRSCINPNGGFRNQLLIYEGILAANKTFRSKLNDSQTITTTIGKKTVPIQTISSSSSIDTKNTSNIPVQRSSSSNPIVLMRTRSPNKSNPIVIASRQTSEPCKQTSHVTTRPNSMI
ncbi:unnamed protein product [Rotaria sp. Silwood1]|nr:unnamed protein product [Rotaria sp. Silwood1]CAF1339734.1 unnamed protein product [Rotaria sp. Silwood1]CAF3552085.1 unnamed protein product [Rotaria sp. Silwood1]CAF3566006.1 unnamed protein product [Rotaria sp. Silwood1]CAF4668862.1 unnamed protein product [Rotaria sp. Silwood1]